MRGIDPLDNLVESRFHQDPLKKGKPESLKVYSAPVARRSKETVWSWATRSFTDPLLGRVRTHLYPGQTEERLYQDATQYELLRTVSDGFDDYGNLTTSHTEAEGTRAAQVKTTTTYAPRIGTYIVDRPAEIAQRDASNVLLAKKSFGYDPQGKGNLTRVILDIDAGGKQATTTREYDTFGNMTLKRNALTHPTFRKYNATYQTYPVIITNALGHTINQAFDGRWGKLKSLTDPNLAQWQWSYDGFGRLSQVALPGETLSGQGLSGPRKIFTYTAGSPGVPSIHYRTLFPLLAACRRTPSPTRISPIYRGKIALIAIYGVTFIPKEVKRGLSDRLLEEHLEGHGDP